MVRSMVPWGTRLPQPRLFESFGSELENWMDRMFGDGNWPARLEAFTPRTNLSETENAFELTVELPGMKPEEFNVEFKEGVLWVTGEKREEKEEKEQTFHRIERHYGEFRRGIPLTSKVNEEAIEAHFENGVLRVTVPKAEAVKPRKIEVKG